MFGEISPKLNSFLQPLSNSQNNVNGSIPNGIFCHNNFIVGNTTYTKKIGINDIIPATNLSVVGNVQIGFSSGTSAPTNGLSVSGQSTFGTTTASGTVNVAFPVTTSTNYAINISGTFSSTPGAFSIFSGNYSNIVYSPAADSNSCYYTAFVAKNSYACPVSSTFGSTIDFWASPTTASNAGTIVNYIGFYFDGGNLSTGGTISTAYGSYFTNPNFGTVKIACYTDNLSVGYNAVSFGTANQVAIKGQLSLGTSTANTNTFLTISGGSSAAYQILTQGSCTSDDGTMAAAFACKSTFGPIDNNINIYGVYSNPYSLPFGGNTVTAVYGVYSQAKCAGSTTTAYSGYFKSPNVISGSATSMALYSDNISVGYTTNTAPSNGTLIYGQSGFGVGWSYGSSPNAITDVYQDYFNTSYPTIHSLGVGLTVSTYTATSAGISISVFTNGSSSSLPAMVGYEFTTSKALNITHLGHASYAALSVFTSGTRSVGIYNNSGTLLTSVTVTYNAGSIQNNFIYTALSPSLNLPAGTYVVVALEPSFGIFLSNVTYSVAAPFTYNATVSKFNTSSFTYYTGNDLAVSQAFGPGFLYSTPQDVLIVNNTNVGINDDSAAANLSVVGNAQIGFSSGTNTSSGCLIVANQIGVGSSTLYGTANFNAYTNNNTSPTVSIYGTSSPTTPSFSIYSGYLNQQTFQPAADTHSSYYVSFFSNSSYIMPNGSTAGICSSFYASANCSSNVGTINNYIGFYFDGGNGTTGGTVSSSVAAYLNSPNFGTSRRALVLIGADASGNSAGCDYLMTMGGTITADDGSGQIGLLNGIVHTPTNNSKNVFATYSVPYITPYSTNTIPQAISIYAAITGSVGSGAITSSYSGYFVNPSVGTNKIALYADNLSVGYTGVTSPTNGAFISGQLIVGTSSITTGTQVNINANITSTSSFGPSGSNSAALFLNPTLNPTSGTSGTISTIYAYGGLYAPTSQTVSRAANIYSTIYLGGNNGTITNLYGILTDSFNSTHGTITNAYGGYFTSPGVATNRQSLYSDDLSVGVAASGTPTSGTIRTAPPSSHTALGAFASSLTLGTAVQNTTGYDILVTIIISVTAAVSANFAVGVGSTSTPTKDNILPSAISVAETFSVSILVPYNYYLLLDKNGTSSTSTNQLIVSAL